MPETISVGRYERTKKTGEDPWGQIGYRFTGVFSDNWSSPNGIVQEVEIFDGKIIFEGRYHDRRSLAHLGPLGTFEPMSASKEETPVEGQVTKAESKYADFFDFIEKTYEEATSKKWNELPTPKQIEIALVIKQTIVNSEGVYFVRT